MKIMRRIMVLCLALSLVFAAYIPAEAAKKVKLNKKSISLKVGKTAKLQIKNTKKKVKWSVKSGKKYISLQKKKKKSVVIKAKKAGTAKVLAKVGKKKLVCTVKVKKSSGGTAGESGSEKKEDKKDDKKKDDKKPVTGTPGQNVPLPAGATVFTIGSKNLALGMSSEDVNTVLGSLSNQQIRTGKAPQGFDTIAYNMDDYQEYLLIYLQDGKVAGICGIGKSMSFGGVSAGDDGTNLSKSDGWGDNSQYKTNTKKIIAAKDKKISANEQIYAFYDALGDNKVYCIQAFDPSNVNVKIATQNNNNMIYATPDNTYNSEVTTSIATEIGHMFNAFRSYKGINPYEMHSSLAQCAQEYCDSITTSKIDSRDQAALLNVMMENYSVDPGSWGEGAYYKAADAISAANSLIELDSFYTHLVDPVYHYIGVGVAAKGSNSYVAVDYVDVIK